MKRNTFYILIISLLFCFNGNAQSVDELVNFADEQYRIGNYAIAAKEYNRAFFFEYGMLDELAFKIAQCYAQLDQVQLASEFYDRAYRLSSDDSLKNEAILANAFCLLIQEQYVLSISELFNVSENINRHQKIHYHFLKGIAHFQLQDDATAFDEFEQAMQWSGSTEDEIAQLQIEFERVVHLKKRYRPRLAYTMSGILPGSGQFYSGSIKDGINSMVLIGGLYLIAVQVMKYYSFWDAALALFPWVQRYYLGGMEKSEGLAQKKLNEKRYESYERILELSVPANFE